MYAVEMNEFADYRDCAHCGRVGDWPGDFCSDDCQEAWHLSRLPARVHVLDSALMWHNARPGAA